MRVELELDGLRAELIRYRDSVLPEAREDATRRAMQAALDAAILATPVDTGRARAGWSAAAAGLEGGTVSNQGEGSATETVTADLIEIEVENGVPYIAFLEHGTRGQPPRHIVRAALTAALEVMQRDFRETLRP